MVMVMAYHFHTSHVHHDDEYDALNHKSHVLKAKYVSCEGGACDEKNDHNHDHKKKRKNMPNIYEFNIAIKAS